MDEAALHAVAAEAAAAWGRLTAPPRLVAARENAVFEASFADGPRAALRLHRPGYHGAARIRAEMLWMEALADAAFPCPWPQRTPSGDLFRLTELGYVATLVQWIDGVPLSAEARPEAALAGLYRDLGALLADLHITSDAVAPASLDRPRWDAAAFCDSDAPLWGRFWDNPALSREEARLLIGTRDALRSRLDALDPAATGLIHADVLQENVLSEGGDLFLIDFDDGGYGFRHYDLATALIQHWATPHFAVLRDALCAGYAEADGPAPDPGGPVLELMLLCRGLASCGWIIARASPDDPRQRHYAARAVEMARAAAL